MVEGLNCSYVKSSLYVKCQSLLWVNVIYEECSASL